MFFPGGNIGELAVYGTVNDLAMRGAKPLFLSAGFILEEGLPMETLGNIVTAMAQACKKAGVKIATGDTKVVQKGHGDGIYINTSGIGVIPAGVDIGPANARPGDAVLVSGTMGDHGIAIMSVREGLDLPDRDPVRYRPVEWAGGGNACSSGRKSASIACGMPPAAGWQPC